MTYQWERLSEYAYRARLPFLDVTVGLVTGSEGVLLVDTGTTLTEAAAIAADVRALTERCVTHIVLTHKHFDHILGSSAFTGASVFAAPEVAEAMTHPEPLRLDARAYGADAQEVDRAIAALRPPEHRIYATAIDLGHTTARVSHPGPGHTDHDLIVVVDDERTVVFCGDLVEESGDPAIDEDSDPAAWATTLDRVLDAGGDDGIFVPGHGAVVAADFVRRQQDWLRSRGLTAPR